MRKFLLPLLLLVCTIGFSQSDTLKDPERERMLKKRDSIVNAITKKRDSLNEVMRLADTQMIKQQFRNSTDYFVRLQNENRAKKKRDAIRYIAIGVSMLAILIVGLRRRSKK